MANSGNTVTPAGFDPGADIEKLYDTFLNSIAVAHPKVNNNLLVKIMALERKFPDSLPHVHLELSLIHISEPTRPY